MDKSNEQALQTLLRSIQLSQGFSIVLPLCNYKILREQIIQSELCIGGIQEISLDKYRYAESLYEVIRKEVDDPQPSALMISELELAENLDTLIISTKHDREKFRQDFPFPIILWVTDVVFQKMSAKAQDFTSWSSVPIRFDISIDKLISLIKSSANSILANLLKYGVGIPRISSYSEAGFLNRSELESAAHDLERRGVKPNSETKAYLSFLQGYNWNNFLDSSQTATGSSYYESSLEIWRANNNFKWQACILYFLGLEEYEKAARALGSQDFQDKCYGKAADRFNQCVNTLKENDETNYLVYKFILALAEAYKRLKQWNKLRNTATEVLKLHENHVELFDKLRIARATGYLAEVALEENKNWVQAEELARQAETQVKATLEILDDLNCKQSDRKIEGILDWHRHFHLGRYLLTLAQAKIHQLSEERLEEKKKEKETEVEDLLKEARDVTKEEYDPGLYVEILDVSRKFYFGKASYEVALKFKKEKQLIEQKYGAQHAFVGINPLQPIVPVQSPVFSPAASPLRAFQDIFPENSKKLIEDIPEQISKQRQHLFIVYGLSGVGKSSFLQAGLIPVLQKRRTGSGQFLPVYQEKYTTWVRTLGESIQNSLKELEEKELEKLGIRNIPVSENLVSEEAILLQLQNNKLSHLLTVLIFDDFEDFFAVYRTKKQRKPFYDFLRKCLDRPSLAIIFSLRQDSMHFLLEFNEYRIPTIASSGLFNKQNLCPLKLFSKDEARKIINTTLADNSLQEALVEAVVSDLADQEGEILPIELQVVGKQLEISEIKTLEVYKELVSEADRKNRITPKDKLIEKFIREIVEDCGPDSEKIAYLLLYILLGSNNDRPFRTKRQLKEGLESANISQEELKNNLDTVLDILVMSDLIVKSESFVPKEEDKANEPTYRLCHDYLLTPIRKKVEQTYSYEAGEINIPKVQLKRIQSIEKLVQESDTLFLKKEQLSALVAITLAYKKVERLDKDILPAHLKNRVEELKVEDRLKRIFYDTEQINILPHHADIYSLSVNNLRGINSCSSSDGSIIASASWDHSVKLWRLDNGKQLESLDHNNGGHVVPVNHVRFSPDGKLLASAGSKDSRVILWQIEYCSEQGEKPLTYNYLDSLYHNRNNPEAWVWDVCFASDSQTLATACGDGKVRLWKLSWKSSSTIDCTRTGNDLKHGDKKVYSVDFSPDGKFLASAGEEGVKVWKSNPEGSWEEITFDNGSRENEKPVKCVKFVARSEGLLLASSGENGKIKISRLVDSSFFTLFNEIDAHDGGCNTINFHPSKDVDVLVSGGNDKAVKLWSLKGELLKTLEGHHDWVRSVEFSPDGGKLISAGDDNTVKVWQPKYILPTTLPAAFRTSQNEDYAYTDKIHSVCFSPSDSKTLASAGWDHHIRIWHRVDSHWEKSSSIRDEGWVWGISFSSDGKVIASGGSSNKIHLWRADSGEPYIIPGRQDNLLGEHRGCVHCVRFSPCDMLLASASFDTTVKLWSPESREPIATCEGHTDSVWSVNFSPDGKSIASASGDKIIKLWDLEGKCQGTFDRENGHSEWINSVVFSPVPSRGDKQILASASNDTTVKLWNVRNGEVLDTLKGHDSKVYDVSFSADGRFLASASADRTIRIWNVEDGILLRVLRGHQDWVNSLTFTSKGEDCLLASGSSDRLIKLWNLSSVNLPSKINTVFEESCNHLESYLKGQETRGYLTDSEKELLELIMAQKG